MGRIIGVNLRSYPAENNFDGYVSIKVVLVEGDVGDYAAYIGNGCEQFVAESGDKISFEEACCHFPGGQLKKENYRI